jgi:hypothetical protein
MACAIDASSPGRVSVQNANSGATIVCPASGTFTPPNGSFLVVCLEWDTAATGAKEDFNFAITNSGTALTWTQQVVRTGLETTAGAGSGIYTAPMPTGAAISVTATKINDTGAASIGTGRISMKVYVVTGVDLAGTPVDSVTANNEGGSTTQALTLTSLTPAADGMQFVADTDWNVTGVITSSDLTLDHAEYTTPSSQIDVADGYRTVTAGVPVASHITAGGAGPQHKWTQILVRSAVPTVLPGPNVIPFPRRMSIQQRMA